MGIAEALNSSETLPLDDMHLQGAARPGCLHLTVSDAPPYCLCTKSVLGCVPCPVSPRLRRCRLTSLLLRLQRLAAGGDDRISHLHQVDAHLSWEVAAEVAAGGVHRLAHSLLEAGEDAEFWQSRASLVSAGTAFLLALFACMKLQNQCGS